MQRELLIAEGIPVTLDGRLPLARFVWLPDEGQIARMGQLLRAL